MDKTDLEYFLEKNIKLVLKNNFIYRGKIERLLSKSMILRDKYSEEVLILLDDIISVTIVEGEGQ